MLVDLVEVVLQDLHLVLRGAARGLRRHGPCACGSLGELWAGKQRMLVPVCLNSLLADVAADRTFYLRLGVHAQAGT